LSETGKFIKSKKREFTKQKEIHPLTHIKKSENKQKIIFSSLLILTIINIFIISLILLYPQNKEELKKENSKKYKENILAKQIENKSKQIEKKETNSDKKNIKKTKKEKKLHFALLDFGSITKDMCSLKIDIDIPKKVHFKPFTKLKDTKKEENFDFFYKKAKEFEKKYDKKSALYYYRKAYKLNPDPDILYKIAYLNYKLEAYFGAKKYAKKLIKENPKYIDGYLLLSNIYLKLRKTKDAKLTLEEAYYKFPENMKLVNSLAYIYEKTGNPYAALELYEALSEKGNLEATIKAAKLYERLGEKDKALEYYRKALSVDKGKYKTWLKDKIKKLSS